MGIALSAPTKVASGATMTYVMTVRNEGTGSATGVVVSNALPTGTVFTSASTTQGTVMGPALGSNRPVSVTLGVLRRGATVRVVVV